MMILKLGDCLDVMADLTDNSVDLILCDPPYGTTACKWDGIIPVAPLWDQYWRVLKPLGAVVLFGIEPFSSYMRTSQIQYFKYDWVWLKNKVTGFMQAKTAPLKSYEQIMVFSRGSICATSNKKMPYYPIGTNETEKNMTYEGRDFLGKRKKRSYTQKTSNYPRNVLKFPHDTGHFHPTQKPVALLEYLIKTYTQEGETVLDNCMGSGSTGVAACKSKRAFIGIEKEPAYFEIAKSRISDSLK